MADIDDILPIFEDGESTDSGMEDLVFRLRMVDCFGNGGYWPSEQERKCIFVASESVDSPHPRICIVPAALAISCCKESF